MLKGGRKMLTLTIGLLILSANGIIIPTSAWVVYAIGWVFVFVKAGIETAQKEQERKWNRLL